LKSELFSAKLEPEDSEPVRDLNIEFFSVKPEVKTENLLETCRAKISPRNLTMKLMNQSTT